MLILDRDLVVVPTALELDEVDLELVVGLVVKGVQSVLTVPIE